MEILKKNVTLSGEWNDGEYVGNFEVGTKEGFWAKVKITVQSSNGYVSEINFDSWESGYVDLENNECTLSESMDNLLAKKVATYLKDSLS